MINFRLVFNLLSYLLMFNGGLMLTALPFCFIEHEDFLPILISACITVGIGFLTWLFTRSKDQISIGKKEGYLLVTLAWLSVSLSGTLPFLLSGAIPSFTDAFFESMSGFTTTGSSILTNIESLPKNILFWRSMTHWFGGGGIIVLAIAILPIIGFGGMHLFTAEATGLTSDKLHPRIATTAKRLWSIYVLLTLAETLLLMLGDMDFFDALNHSMATIATGGFSPKNTSIVEYSAYTQYVIILFMFLGGMNFSLHYYALKGKFTNVLKDEELRFYLFVILAISFTVAAALYWRKHLAVEQAVREALFNVTSVITTTGFVSANYEQWTPFLVYLMLIITFLGGCAGSTAGGLKMIRIRLLLKDSVLELKRLLHPRAVIPVRISDKSVRNETMTKVLAFFFFYNFIFISGSVALTMLGMDILSSMGAVVTCMSNVGPGIGSVGPMDNFSQVPDLGKWILAFLMLVGRLEIFTVLILFSPGFWRKI